jgi:exoribonuclease-2
VGLPVYSQVTSPLRRYLDLVVHQQLRAYLRGEDLLEVAQVVERIGAVEAVSGNVRRGEQLSNRHWTLVYLSRNPQWGGAGILVDRRDQRGTLLIPDLNLEIQMYIQGEPESDRVVPLVLQGVDLPRLEAHFRQEGRRRK